MTLRMRANRPPRPLDPAVSAVACGDCAAVLDASPAGRVQLIVTSPPYADARAEQYGGPPPDRYVEWFLPRAAAFLRALRPDGTFVLNIKEKAVDGERHTYVLDLIRALRAQGWVWTEEFVWHKRNCSPGKWPNRFRDAWERCLQFNRSKAFKMRQDAVRVPVGDWAKARLKNLSATDRTRDPSKVGSGFGKRVANWVGRDLAYPTNVLHLASECGNTGHSAAFPPALPEFFVNLFTDPGDLVCDPFCGSGTVPFVCAGLGRTYWGVDVNPAFVRAARVRAGKVARGQT